ncbi:MFS general substrate transporter [Thozetella sp. PMI_491]|nr:MFS general substrate transporter [Thozetella sp. PMI_491]
MSRLMFIIRGLLTWFVGSFDSTLMASSYPVISTYFSASRAAPWFSASFLITSCSFSPIFARISDTFGRRLAVLFSLVVFAFGTLWCAIAPTVLNFILARALCGLGAGASLSQTDTLISDLVPLRIRGAFISWINLAYGTGSSLGAALGGEFGIQVLAIFAVTWVIYAAVPPNLGLEFAKRDPRSLLETIRSFDLLGSLLLALSTTGLTLFLALGGSYVSWTHPLVLTCFLVSVLSGAALVHIEGQTEKPILPLAMLFKSPGGQVVFSNFLNCMSINTVFFNSPLFFQAVLLDSPSVSGARLMTPFLLGMVAAFATGNIITWVGQLRWLILGGYLLILAGLAAMSLMDALQPAWVYSAAITLALIGQGFAFPTCIIAQLAVNSQEDAAVATTALLLFKNLGNVMGVAVSGLVSQNSFAFFLEQTVQGPEKRAIIEAVRKAVGAISELRPPYQAQVVQAYPHAMHLTCFQGAVTALIGLLLVLFIKLPVLHKKGNQVDES